MSGIEPQVIHTLQTHHANGWSVGEAVIVGAVGYTASILLLSLSFFAIYSIPNMDRAKAEVR